MTISSAALPVPRLLVATEGMPAPCVTTLMTLAEDVGFNLQLIASSQAESTGSCTACMLRIAADSNALVVYCADAIFATIDLPCRLQALRPLLQAARARFKAQAITLASGWRLSPHLRSISHPLGRSLALTDRETDILRLLAQHADGLERDALAQAVWPQHRLGDSHALDALLYRLRSKLESLGDAALTITHEKGLYRLNGLEITAHIATEKA